MEVINTIGRRKAAIARVYMTEGKGQITINNRDFSISRRRYVRDGRKSRRRSEAKFQNCWNCPTSRATSMFIPAGVTDEILLKRWFWLPKGAATTT